MGPRTGGSFSLLKIEHISSHKIKRMRRKYRKMVEENTEVLRASILF